MRTPIYDFLRDYAAKNNTRLHMPGHKGKGLLGEALDLTEVKGADSLYEAEGIIAESEAIAGKRYGAHTIYSTEGSSLSIRAMIYLITLCAAERGERPLILASRNAHKSFISAVALLDIEVEWLPTSGSYLSCLPSPDSIRELLMQSGRRPTAVYLTSPDYLGNRAKIREIAEACHDFGVLLAVDNAHGAYLKFLVPSEHPIDLGADICCDSAHKTLPVLTGGGYLHISNGAPAVMRENAKCAMALFGSTSPSYLILASLDLANRCDWDFPEFAVSMSVLKEAIANIGYRILGDEPYKITIDAKDYGYLGYELAERLESDGVIPEFADPDFVVLMLTPANTEDDLLRLCDVMSTIPQRPKIATRPPTYAMLDKVMTSREAVLSSSERINVSDAVGRIAATVEIGCPPAVPIVISGERITEEAVNVLRYYGTDRIAVVKER